MKISLFTVETANRLLPEIRPVLEELRRLKGEVDRAQKRMDVLEVVTAGASDDNPDLVELRALVQRRAMIADRIQHGVQRIHRLGPMVKDLDRGLVDFHALNGDRLILLCWQLSEPEVAYWHSLDGGFAGRQSIHRSERD